MSASSPPPTPQGRPREPINRESVAHLAHLARLDCTDAELDAFAGELEVILGAVARVGEADVAGVEPTTHAVAMSNVLRPDVVTESLPVADVLAGAPVAEQDRFRVPRILDEEA